MQGYFTLGSFILLIMFVLIRSAIMKKHGIKAFHFGKIDKKDFIIPPFVLCYLYFVIANIFNLPRIGETIIENNVVSWIGAGICILAPVMFIWGMISFGNSFRVGIDIEKPGSLVKSGAFSISRNPLYIAFFMMLTGIFLIFPTWIFFTYLMAGLWLIDRQVCLEENSLRDLYGKEYDEYCVKVRRYL